MPLESVQCPNCGAPIPAGRMGSLIVCPMCRSTLRMVKGESGYGMARLERIGKSADFLARREATLRLRERIAQTEAALEVARTEAAARPEPEPPPPNGLVILAEAVAFLIALLTAYYGEIWLTVIFGIIAVIFDSRRRSLNAKRLRDVQDAHAEAIQAPVRKLEAQLAAFQEQLCRLEADLDHATRDMARS